MSATPSPHDEPGRQRPRRGDYGTVRFWQRDLELLSFIGEQYAVSVQQLARINGVSIRATVALRDRWRRAGWVESHALLWRGPGFVWLTPRGVKAAGSPYHALRPDPSTAAHILAVTEVRLLLERELALGSWECERALAKSTWRGPGPQAHLPDAVLDTDHGRIAIEVELTPKGMTRLEPIFEALALRYPRTWYFAAARVAPPLRRLAQQTPWRGIEVYSYPPEASELPA